MCKCVNAFRFFLIIFVFLFVQNRRKRNFFWEMKRPPVQKKKNSTPWRAIVGVVILLVAGVAWFGLRAPAVSSQSKQPAAKTHVPSSDEEPQKDESPIGSFRFWESEFSSVLWTQSIGPTLSQPPFLFESPGALVKEVENPQNKNEVFRALLFDRSGEVQGVNVMDKVKHVCVRVVDVKFFFLKKKGFWQTQV